MRSSIGGLLTLAAVTSALILPIQNLSSRTSGLEVKGRAQHSELVKRARKCYHDLQRLLLVELACVLP